MDTGERKKDVAKVSIKILSWFRKQFPGRPRLGSGTTSGAGQWHVPGKATGRVASMPRLRCSLESTDLDPMVGEDWGLSPLPEPKETEMKPRRHNHFVASKQLLSWRKGLRKTLEPLAAVKFVQLQSLG